MSMLTLNRKSNFLGRGHFVVSCATERRRVFRLLELDHSWTTAARVFWVALRGRCGVSNRQTPQFFEPDPLPGRRGDRGAASVSLPRGPSESTTAQRT